jgi:hypothetical protein
MIGRRGAAALLAAVCLLAVPAASATAAGRAGGISVSIHASSALSVSGDTVVEYQYTGHDTAKISGQLTGGSAGQRVTLLAQPFPYLTPFLPAGPAVSLTGAAQTYSFTAQPVIATRYQVQVTSAGAKEAVLARSQVVTVYVSKQVTFGSYHKTCARPVCKLAIRAFVTTPPLSYQAEAAKRWYAYLALKLSRNRQPKPADKLSLDSKAVIGPVREVSENEFEVTATITFTIGHTEGYYWNVNLCQQDSYLTDGIGLPGSHGCGGPGISSQPGYLG